MTRIQRAMMNGAAGFILLVTPLWADRIRLTNGRTVEGIIEKEEADKVLVNLGVGSMRIARDQIRSIERATPEDMAVLQREWQDRYFLNDRYIPASMTALGKEFRALADRCADAAKQKSRLGELEAKLRQLEADNQTLQKQAVEASRRLTSESPTRDIRRYNEAVTALNTIRARQVVDQDRHASMQAERDATGAGIMGYTRGFLDFADRYRRQSAALRARAGADATELRFLDLLEKRLADMEKAVSTVVVKLRVAGGNTLVNVRVNGKVDGWFVVDTGASLMTLTEPFRARLGQDLATRRDVEVTLADGTTRKAPVVSLSTVRVGTTEARDIEAAILPGSAGGPVDGLLGMSFLGRFQIHLDVSRGELILHEFKP